MKRYIRKLIEDYGLCVWCVGRQLTKEPAKFYEEGLKMFRSLEHEPRTECWLCGGFFNDKTILNKIYKELNKFEFNDIDFGVILDPAKINSEDEIRSKYKITGGLILKKAILSYLRHKFSTLYGFKINITEPDIKVILHIEKNDFSIKVKPVFLELRFLKYTRESRIRADSCERCDGKGCEHCRWTGKKRDGSLESFLLFEFAEMVKGEIKIRWTVKDYETSLIEGLGRPVYLILRNSKKRNTAAFLMPYKPVYGFQISLSRKINKMEMKDVFIQTTCIEVESSKQLSKSDIERSVSFFKNRKILIVDRNGKTRDKIIYYLTIEKIEDYLYKITLKHDTGLNLEKFISGKGKGSEIDAILTDFFDGIDIKIKKIVVCAIEEKGN